MQIPTVYHPVIGKSQKPNFYNVHTSEALFWFSYATCIAFTTYTGKDGTQTHIRENDWGPTTGKHLNHVEMNSRNVQHRIPGEEFCKLLGEM